VPKDLTTAAASWHKRIGDAVEQSQRVR